MDQILLSGIVGLVSLLVGSLIGTLVTRWWDRARVLVQLHGFSDVSKMTKMVECPQELFELTEKSFYISKIRESRVELGELARAREAAIIQIVRYESAKNEILPAVQALEKSENSDELKAAFQRVIAHQGICDALELAFLRKLVVIDPPRSYQGSPSIQSYESDERDGSYRVVWETSVSRVGQGLRAPERKDRLRPLILAIGYLDKEVFLKAAKVAQGIINTQWDIHTKIRDVTTPIVDREGQWVGKLIVVNYGANALVIWPDAKLIGDHSPSRGHFPLEAYVGIDVPIPVEVTGAPIESVGDIEGLNIIESVRPQIRATIHAMKKHVRDLEGVRTLLPGEQVTLWVFTAKVQGEIPGGDALRGHYKTGDAEAYILLHVTRRGLVFSDRVKSNKLKFSRSDDLVL